MPDHPVFRPNERVLVDGRLPGVVVGSDTAGGTYVVYVEGCGTFRYPPAQLTPAPAGGQLNLDADPDPDVDDPRARSRWQTLTNAAMEIELLAGNIRREINALLRP